MIFCKFGQIIHDLKNLRKSQLRILTIFKNSFISVIQFPAFTNRLNSLKSIINLDNLTYMRKRLYDEARKKKTPETIEIDDQHSDSSIMEDLDPNQNMFQNKKPKQKKYQNHEYRISSDDDDQDQQSQQEIRQRIRQEEDKLQAKQQKQGKTQKSAIEQKQQKFQQKQQLCVLSQEQSEEQFVPSFCYYDFFQKLKQLRKETAKSKCIQAYLNLDVNKTNVEISFNTLFPSKLTEFEKSKFWQEEILACRVMILLSGLSVNPKNDSVEHNCQNINFLFMKKQFRQMSKILSDNRLVYGYSLRIFSDLYKMLKDKQQATGVKFDKEVKYKEKQKQQYRRKITRLFLPYREKKRDRMKKSTEKQQKKMDNDKKYKIHLGVKENYFIKIQTFLKKIGFAHQQYKKTHLMNPFLAKAANLMTTQYRVKYIRDMAILYNQLSPENVLNYKFYTKQHNLKYLGTGELSIQELLKKKEDYQWLEKRHDYFHWLFPTHQITFQSDQYHPLSYIQYKLFLKSQEAGKQIIKSFELFLDFIGVSINFSNLQLTLENRKRLVDAMMTHTHNQIRIKRVLMCLSTIGFRFLALNLVSFLKYCVNNDSHLRKVQNIYQRYWGVFDDIDKNVAKKNCYMVDQDFPEMHLSLKKRLDEQFGQGTSEKLVRQTENFQDQRQKLYRRVQAKTVKTLK